MIKDGCVMQTLETAARNTLSPVSTHESFPKKEHNFIPPFVQGLWCRPLLSFKTIDHSAAWRLFTATFALTLTLGRSQFPLFMVAQFHGLKTSHIFGSRKQSVLFDQESPQGGICFLYLILARSKPPPSMMKDGYVIKNSQHPDSPKMGRGVSYDHTGSQRSVIERSWKPVGPPSLDNHRLTSLRSTSFRNTTNLATRRCTTAIAICYSRFYNKIDRQRGVNLWLVAIWSERGAIMPCGDG